MTPGICAAAGFIRDSQNYLFYTKGYTPGSLVLWYMAKVL
jgi:hypothetical protein